MEQRKIMPTSGGIQNFYYGTVKKVINVQRNVYQGVSDGKVNKQFTDKQIAKALLACVGENKVIDAKWKFSGAYWYLRHACKFPMDPKKFCDRVNGLPCELPIKCEYRNIREYVTLSFMDEDPTDMENVKYRTADFNVFKQCREIVLKLADELENTFFSKV